MTRQFLLRLCDEAGGQRQEDGGGNEEAEGRAKVSKFFNFLNCQG